MAEHHEGHANGTEHEGSQHSGSHNAVAGSRQLHFALIVVIALVLAYNQFSIGGMQSQLSAVSSSATRLASQVPAQGTPQQTFTPATGGSQPKQPSGSVTNFDDVAAKVMPKGIPAVYGAELGVSFDEVEKSMNIMAKMDDGKGMADKSQNERYVRLGVKMACEYCCGATTLVFQNGNAACGCAHSFAMRGLLKYLIQKHPDMTDEAMLEETGKWKTSFFPGPSMKKAVLLADNGVELSYVNLQSNIYRDGKGLKSSGGTGSAAVLPGQVGGC